MEDTRIKAWTNEEVEVSKLLKALAHPARLAIINYLSSCSSCINGELVDILPLSRTTVFQHLNELKKAGLIQGNVQGPYTCYCLDPEGMKKLHALSSGLFLKWNTESCCR